MLFYFVSAVFIGFSMAGASLFAFSKCGWVAKRFNEDLG